MEYRQISVEKFFDMQTKALDIKTFTPGDADLKPLRSRQITMLFNQQASVISANLVAGTSLFIILLLIGAQPILYIWYLALIIVTVLRSTLIHQYKKYADNHICREQERWLRWLIIGAIFSGAIWGFSWLPLYPGEAVLAEGAVVLWVSGMCAGATSTLSLTKITYFSFTLPAVIPVVAYLFYVGETIEKMLAYALIMYFGFTILIAFRNQKDLNQGLELQLTNDRLLKKLRTEEANLQRKNEELLIQRQREAQLQEELLRKERLATLGQLAGTVSHELRNPLATLYTTFSIIKLKLKDKVEGIDGELQRIDRNIERCDRIIGDILDYAKATPPELELTEFDPWLDMVLTEFDIPKNIELERKLNSLAVISIDRERISRALLNLIDNAVQAMTEEKSDGDKNGPHCLSVKTEFIDSDLQISIRDNGPGMSEEASQKIFEPLFSTKMFGVGLGLPIVEQIVKEHEGSIECSTQTGEGTEFVISLPVLTT